MQLFYQKELNKSTTEFTFNKEESRHIVKVLRKKIGDTLDITNGDGYHFKAEIIVSDIKNCVCKITEVIKINEKRYHLHLVVAPTKMNDRYEWFLEKAVEIGVDEITPVICDHSERTVIKKERFEKIIQSAMKQSLQFYLPKLNDAISFNDFIKKIPQGQLFIAHCEDHERFSLKRRIMPDHDATVLIGPEGDFSKEEIETALELGYTAVSLGSNRLRTETAAIVACHTIALAND
ncbi:16S rRNA (uracil1498-N3)-methyltransferase [Zhouia amylolytica]|uniref:Ribosomal RNA small subunit methyltransferase E n=2 Tax=Zhouia amylolytica TaxID=376730 RepID=W2UQB0_9FLAO|nr:16S rRNA (uracil(1498)-N(3))-methyltransferase [Zhouia amylolytica]ETN96188.1 RNA methyltransferase, RsmE family [Zhouia amylolytica AD3]MCQ0112309.1 16S rRNA (uracil(1498)-N(3))-methyltransferase [Zhouia amylolytica]SFT13863.1 16S rRNA (uracil1498-N3)-methyltransferase [Zhouia amylolytica]